MRSYLKDEIRNVIPFDRVIWNGRQCAEYLGVSYRIFMRSTQWHPSFPKRLPVPGHPRWSAQAVSQWALGEILPESRQHLEKSAA